MPTTNASQQQKHLRSVAAKPAGGLFTYTANDGKEYSLTLKEKLFSEAYLSNKGNGAQAAIDAGYNVANKNGQPNRTIASTIARENLQKLHIFSYINTLLGKYGFNSENVEQQHLFLINQYGDLSAKAKGIDMFYKVKGKYPKDQLEISLIAKYQNASDDELSHIIDGEIAKED